MKARSRSGEGKGTPNSTISEPTSRLFIKNLPKHATEQTIKEHFSAKGGQLTDVKLLKDEKGVSRRAAFIGFRSVEEAAEAKDHFNRTFFHTSRLDVVFALPLGDPALERLPGRRQKAVTKTTESQAKAVKGKGKHDDFLELMAPKAADFWDEDEDEKKESDGEKDGFETQQKDTKDSTSNRLFVRNLAYTTSKEDLMNAFSKFNVEDVVLPADELHRPKGFAIVRFPSEAQASQALQALDGKPFQGRLMHIIPAEPERVTSSRPSASGLEKDFKAVREAQRREKAGTKSDQRAWHSLFIRSDAAASALAKKLGVSKRELILGGEEDDDAAVRVAMSEAKVIAENKAFLEDQGVDLGALEASLQPGHTLALSDTVLLVKNLPESTVEADLRSMFAKIGTIERFVLPPSRSMALVVYHAAADAKKALKTLAYSRYKNVPLYIQFAPDRIISKRKSDVEKADDEEKQDVDDEAQTSQVQRVLFVKNLEFSVTEEELRKHVRAKCDFDPQHVSIPKKRGKNGTMLSSGYGFVQFADESEASIALKKLNGSELKGHVLDVKVSQNIAGAATSTSVSKPVTSTTPSEMLPIKIIVRNLAFEATKKDVKKLFEAHADVKSVRLPKKMDGSTRGFAFVEFSTHQQAKNAIQALGAAHLYGRRLVVEFVTTEDAALEEEEAVQDRKRMRGEA